MSVANRARLLEAVAGPQVLPAMLECDYARLAEVVARLEAAGARMLHLDVMDGHFVPNLSYGPPVIRSLRNVTQLPFDAHLMIANPEPYVDEYIDAGCEKVIVHLEALADPRPILEHMRERGVMTGIALNPPTPVEGVEPFFDLLDAVLPMSVMPGFSGQAFDAGVLAKIAWLRRHGPANLLIECDGGVGAETIPELVRAGAGLLCVGSGIFRAPDIGAAFQSLQQLAESA